MAVEIGEDAVLVGEHSIYLSDRLLGRSRLVRFFVTTLLAGRPIGAVGRSTRWRLRLRLVALCANAYHRLGAAVRAAFDARGFDLLAAVSVSRREPATALSQRTLALAQPSARTGVFSVGLVSAARSSVDAALTAARSDRSRLRGMRRLEVGASASTPTSRSRSAVSPKSAPEKMRSICGPVLTSRPRRVEGVDDLAQALGRQILVGILEDHHHRRVDAGAKALDLFPGKRAGRIEMELVVVDLRWQTSISSSEPRSMQGVVPQTWTWARADRLQLELRVEGRDLEHADQGMSSIVGDMLDRGPGHPAFLLLRPHQTAE